MATEENGDLRPIEVMWSPAKVAAYMGINVETVYRMVRDGRLPNTVKLGGVLRIPQSDVQNAVNDARKALVKQHGESNS